MKAQPILGIGLLLVSAGAGCLDVLSYRYLGEVFPSAMTGNLALLGRGIGEGDVAAATRNLCAFGGFFAGALFGAALLRGKPGRWRMASTVALEAAVLGGLAWWWDPGANGLPRLELIGAAAFGMGMQSAAAMRIGVQAVSTTYFTGTTTQIAIGLVCPGTLPSLRWPVLALGCFVAGAGLAGWSIAGHGPPDLQVLPAVAALLLAAAVAVTKPP